MRQFFLLISALFVDWEECFGGNWFYMFLYGFTEIKGVLPPRTFFSKILTWDQFFFIIGGLSPRQEKNKNNPPKVLMSAKKIAAWTKICYLCRAVISQQPLIRFCSNFARCSKIPCSVFSTRIFYFEVKLPSKLFFFWNFHNFSRKNRFRY